jgi:hypothetical protein
MKAIKIIIIVLGGIIIGGTFIITSKINPIPEWYEIVSYVILNLWVVYSYGYTATKFSKWFDSKLKQLSNKLPDFEYEVELPKKDK